MNKITSTIFACILLGACQGNDTKEMLGMKIDAPDEFAVERKPKLEVPPSFKLRPPTPGEESNAMPDTRDVVKEQITGIKTPTAANSAGEKTFLSQVGVNNANPNIRNVLTQEYPATAEMSTLEKIRSISDKNVKKTLVDQDKEKARIQENLKNKKPVNEGETPTKSMNDGQSVIDKIF